MLKTKGVLLLAVKHSNYVKMAFNLALSLKVVNKDVSNI